MSCERYFVEFPPQEPLTAESFLEESLALIYPKDIVLHRAVFLVPFEPTMLVKMEKKRLWSKSQKKYEYNPASVLRKNIKFMVAKTRSFGLLLSQLTWVGLLNLAEKRHVLQHTDMDLRAAALYIIMLKKEPSALPQILNCMHMTGNHVIANIIEEKLELLAENLENCEDYGHCSASDDEDESSEEHPNRAVPPKKRKTSSDSAFDDEDDDPDMESSFAAAAAAAAISSMNGYTRRKFKCNIKPLGAVDVIAIINGKEDCKSKVELCKCGHYHQYPKWKDISTEHASVNNENSFIMKSHGMYSSRSVFSSSSKMSSSAAVPGGFAKYFVKNHPAVGFRKHAEKTENKTRQGILSPVSHSQQVEVGLDLSHGMPDNLEFTKPRRSCSHLRLRFSSENSFAEHPDNIQAADNSAQGEDKDVDSLMSKLPRFFRKLL